MTHQVIRLLPKYNTLFVIKDKKIDTTEGGIFFPTFDKYKKVEDRKVNTGTVLAVGNFPDDIEYKFKKDDRVFFGVYSGIPFQFQGLTIHIMLTDEILGYFHSLT